RTVEQLEARSDAYKREVRELIDGLVSHYDLDEGKLVVALAGLEESLQGRASGRVRSFALYGETTGEIDAFGLPVRADWARGYRGRAMVVYGHTPTPRAEWVNNTICIDTGCVFGGKLTALRYPERELVSVDAARVYYEPTRPLDAPRVSEDRAGLALSDVSGTRVVHVRHARDVTVHEANATAALEVMSRCAVDPRWLIYLPPTMSPPEASREEGLLEHPKEAFAYFRDAGIVDVVCEEKHMGSRAVIVVCTSADAARARFGVDDGSQGVVYTRTGRPLFRDRALEEEVLQRVAAAGRAAGLFASLGSEWMCLDVEILPWSTKAQERARRQCADIAAAGRAGFGDALGALRRLAEHDPSASMVFDLVAARLPHVEDYERAYRGHAWEVSGLDGYAVAPFHLLASEGRVHVDPRHDHVWHMETLAALCRADSSLLRETRYEAVDLTDEESEARAIAWWTSLTDAGGEGMVVKPRQYLWSDERGLGQPALKCRGREYLRIVYGLEYPEHLERLRRRDVRLERRLAKKQLALGLEALHRFVDREPVSRVHECVFAVLALESEPVDPRP
ncbi:MAG: polynucleotide kinase-phosphatase, partial [Sandaracinaceae bacterium]